MERRGGLGKGLGALIPSDVARSSAAGLAARPGIEEIPINQIDPNPYQPRNNFDEESLAGLTASIRELGVLQPILVRQVSDDRYAIIAGERRWRAAKRAGLQFIPVIVRQVNDELTLQHALVENLHRDDLNPLEEAAAYQQLVEDFDLTQEEVAQKVGKSRSAVANLLRLFQLPPQVQRLVAEGRVSAGHAKALLGTPDRAFQESLARRVATDGLSVRETEEAVRQRNGLAGSPGGSPGTSGTRSKLRAPGLLELEELLAEQLDTRVSINVGPKRGRVVIEFADLEDLERIYRVMAVPH
ncbi:MAG TPA: ParB/RepB/Spo0J family partition protein [Acidimicrobiales bacterium]|nr:ParB/RepB/Spo0J family partition protein [Acidimicrobiales bacterium]